MPAKHSPCLWDGWDDCFVLLWNNLFATSLTWPGL